ncbi:hypothetical protein SESBI_00149 [Sesbania bispinosa]|nr:hypothetical protein SESBI_00149 [Sesbania bispinosa]
MSSEENFSSQEDSSDSESSSSPSYNSELTYDPNEANSSPPPQQQPAAPPGPTTQRLPPQPVICSNEPERAMIAPNPQRGLQPNHQQQPERALIAPIPQQPNQQVRNLPPPNLATGFQVLYPPRVQMPPAAWQPMVAARVNARIGFRPLTPLPLPRLRPIYMWRPPRIQQPNAFQRNFVSRVTHTNQGIQFRDVLRSPTQLSTNSSGGVSLNQTLSQNIGQQGIPGVLPNHHEMGESSSRNVRARMTTQDNRLPLGELQLGSSSNPTTNNRGNENTSPRFINTVYDLSFEEQGLPIDPHLRYFHPPNDN